MTAKQSPIEKQLSEAIMTSSDDQPIRSFVRNTHTTSNEVTNKRFTKDSNIIEQLHHSNSPDYKSCVFKPPEGLKQREQPIMNELTHHEDNAWSHVEAAMLGCHRTVAGLLQGVGVNPEGNEDREKALWRTIQGHSH